MHKKSFSKAAASLYAVTLLVAPSVYADQSAIGFDNLTAGKATADFCAGKVTSEALVTAALSRAKALAELNVFITLVITVRSLQLSKRMQQEKVVHAADH